MLNEDTIGPWSMEITCKCGAILEVFAEDFKKFGDFDGGYEVGVYCKRCRVKTIVKDAPSIVWETVK